VWHVAGVTTPVDRVHGEAPRTGYHRSGINAELLAGEVYRGETVAPTRSVNVWYGRNVAFVEASGAVTSFELIQANRGGELLARMVDRGWSDSSVIVISIPFAIH
jgi:hypothetical protein